MELRQRCSVQGIRKNQKSRVCVKTMRVGFERVIERRGEPKGWRKSRTVILSKSRKPTVYDLRPITLSEVAYKIIMQIIVVGFSVQ